MCWKENKKYFQSIKILPSRKDKKDNKNFPNQHIHKIFLYIQNKEPHVSTIFNTPPPLQNRVVSVGRYVERSKNADKCRGSHEQAAFLRMLRSAFIFYTYSDSLTWLLSLKVVAHLGRSGWLALDSCPVVPGSKPASLSLPWTASPLVCYQLEWYFAAGCPLWGATVEEKYR